MQGNKGFFASLFDISFSSFVTSKLIKVVYVLWMVIAALLAIGVIVAGFGQSTGSGILALVLSPVAFFLYLILGRVYCELVIVLFRIAENVRDIANR
jgi:hypothetical protein